MLPGKSGIAKTTIPSLMEEEKQKENNKKENNTMTEKQSGKK